MLRISLRGLVAEPRRPEAQRREASTAHRFPAPKLARVPDATVESFGGVANHWPLGRVVPGSVVLDLGCGAGTDLLIAAQMTGPTARVIGVDMTPAMLERPARARSRWDSGTCSCTSR